MERKKIDNLCSDAVDVKPVDVDWSKGYGETWETFFPYLDKWSYSQGLDWIDGKGYDHDKKLNRQMPIDKLQDLVRGFMNDDPDAFMPMMNYYYPLPNFRLDPGEAQTILEFHAGAVVLVEYAEKPVLALSGGGMDLSWDICEAFMLLSYLPPVHFCDLSDMAGMKYDERNRWILAGCRASLLIQIGWNQRKINKLQQVAETLKKNEEKTRFSTLDI